MPTNVEVLVSFETFGNVITANANTTAYQHLDHIYSNTIVYQIPADPLLTITQFSMIAVAGGGGNQYGGFGAGGFGSNSNLIAQYGSVYSVTVGGPGNGASNGGISSVYGPNVSFSLLGGGYGGGGNGNPGGSGGGAGGYASVGSGTAGQGNPGGGGGDPRYGAFA
ncbi:hypothetical protein EBU95_15350, partial [bacterium]|nr:hypothetical protein [bacterium]